MIGYDFNGVVDTGKFIPTETDVIITGNTIPMAKSVISWLGQHGIFCVVYFQPYPHGANNMIMSGIWKAEMINRLELDKFYEDDPIQFSIIKEFARRCEIIKV